MALFGDSRADERKAAELAEQISRNIAGTIAESIRLCMEPVFAELAGAVKASLSEANKQQQETAKQMAGAFLTELKAQTGETFGALNADAASLAQTMKADAEALTQAQQENIRAYRENVLAQQELAEKLAAGAGQLAEISREQKSTLDELRTISRDMSAKYDAVLDKLEGTMSAVNAAYEKIGAGTADAVADQSRTVAELKQMLDGFGRDYGELQKAELAGIRQRIEELGGSLGELQKTELAELHKSIEEYGAGFEKLQSSGTQSLQKKIDDMCTNLDKLRSEWTDKYISCDDALSKNAASLLENMEKSNRAMQLCGEAFDKAAGAMKTNLSSIESDISKSLKNFETGMEQNVNHILEIMDRQIAGIAQTLGKTAEDISESAQKIPKALRGITG